MIRHVDPDHPDFKYEPPVVAALPDLNAYYESLKHVDIPFANDFQVDTEERREKQIEMLTKTYTSDTLDEPINGANPLFEPVVPSMWIRPIGNGRFVHPKFLTMITKVLTKDKVNIIQHLMDPSYKLPNTTPKGIVKTYLEADFPRGMKAFEDNFDAIMELLVFEQYRRRNDRRSFAKVGKSAKRQQIDYVAMVIEKYRDRIFCNYLPITSSQLFILEKRDKNKVSEVPLMHYAFDAVNTVTSLSQRIRPVTPKEADRLDYKVNHSLSRFGETYSSLYLKSKPGIFRKNSYGTTTSFNSRSVIVSIQGKHQYDTLKIPYALAFKIFEIHIAKIFIDRHGYNPIDIFEMRSTYARQFSPEIHAVMMELIQGFWGGRGWPENFLRHPYLFKLSSQFGYIDDIGIDPMDMTTALSTMGIKGSNADFDGDEMVLKIHLDKYTADLWAESAPHLGALDQNKALSYSGDLDLPKPMTLQLYRYLGYDKR